MRGNSVMTEDGSSPEHIEKLTANNTHVITRVRSPIIRKAFLPRVLHPEELPLSLEEISAINFIPFRGFPQSRRKNRPARMGRERARGSNRPFRKMIFQATVIPRTLYSTGNGKIRDIPSLILYHKKIPWFMIFWHLVLFNNYLLEQKRVILDAVF